MSRRSLTFIVLAVASASLAGGADAGRASAARHVIRLAPPDGQGDSRATGVVRVERRRGRAFAVAAFRGLAPSTGYALRWGSAESPVAAFTTDRTGRAKLARTLLPAVLDIKSAEVTVVAEDGDEALDCGGAEGHTDAASHGEHHDVVSGNHMNSAHHGADGHGSSGHHGGGDMHGGGMMKR